MGDWKDKLWRLYADIAYKVRDERHRKRIAFQRFQRDIACDRERYAAIKTWAEEQAERLSEPDVTENGADTLVREGVRLRCEALESYKGCLAHRNAPVL